MLLFLSEAKKNAKAFSSMPTKVWKEKNYFLKEV
jgi:hypothetical protein